MTRITEGSSRAGHGAEGHMITEEQILEFADLLREQEKSIATIDKYTRDVRTFLKWMKNTLPGPADKDTVSCPADEAIPCAADKDTVSGPVHEATAPGPADKAAVSCPDKTTVPSQVDKDTVRRFKLYLKDHYKLSSANSMLSALNTFFKYMGWQECSVMTFKVQRAAFRNTDKDLSLEEYQSLVRAAETQTGRGEKGGRQLALVMETLAGTGIRVSELPFITVASLAARRALVSLKGKTRTVLLNSALCRKLRAYCRDRGITDGSIFVTRTGRPLDRSAILRRMKQLGRTAGVLRDKIFPHNLRHLFAVTYYEREKDIVRLADILGHANINTTRIYTLVTCETQLTILDQLGSLLNPAG